MVDTIAITDQNTRPGTNELHKRRLGAVGVDLKTPLEYQLFVDGFTEMVRRLEPLLVLAYGRLPAACHELVEIVTYPTRWTSIREARRHSGDPLLLRRWTSNQ